MAGTLSAPALQRGSLDFERLISETSAALMAAPLDAIDLAIEVALDRVRTFFGADRCALIAVSADRRLARVSHASYAEGVVAVSGDINLAELFPWSRGRLLDDRSPVVVHSMADLRRKPPWTARAGSRCPRAPTWPCRSRWAER